MRRIIPALVALCLVPAPAHAATLKAQVRQALKVAKQANAKADAALSRVTPAETGPSGRDGLNGRDGSSGPAGARGDSGPQGTTGAQGSPGIASLDAQSATNPATVVIGSAPTTVATLVYTPALASLAFITVDAQVNGENGTPDGILCELRSDGSTVAERFVSVGGGDQVSVSASALSVLSADPHSVAFVCRKGSDLSDVEFPADRARVTVLGG